MKTSKHSASSRKPPHTAQIVITADDLPPDNRIHWNPNRKAIVVSAVVGGLISIHDACTRYELSIEEFLIWKRAAMQNGAVYPCAARRDGHSDAPFKLAA